VLSARGIRSAIQRPWARTGKSRGRTTGQGGTFSALRFRNYRLFWSGQLVSVTGTFMQGTAQQWLVLTLTPNPLALGVVGALQFGPMLIPFGGAVGDRWPRRSVLVATQSAAAILAFALFLLTVTHTLQLWHVYVLAFLLGTVNMVDMPTRQAFVGEMVPAEYLLNAVSLNSAQFNASRIVGPGIAGAMIALLGVPPLFLLNALSFLAVILSLFWMRPAELVPMPRAAMGHGVARVRALGEGFRFILHNPKMRVTILMVLVTGTMGFNFSVLLPLEAHGVLHAGPQIFGLLTSSLGAGALVGALVLAKRGGRPTNRQLVTMAGAFGICEAAVGLTRSVPATLALIALTGFFMSSFSAAANTRTQLSSPPEIRGRVLSVYSMVFIGTTPFGNLIVSGVAASAGVNASWIVSGLPCLAIAVVAAFLWARQSGAPEAQSALVTAPEAERAPDGEIPAPPLMPRGAGMPGMSLGRTADRSDDVTRDAQTFEPSVAHYD
jgi:MFS family permease